MKIKPECEEKILRYISEMSGCQSAISALADKLGRAEVKMWDYILIEHDLPREKQYTLNHTLMEITEK